MNILLLTMSSGLRNIKTSGIYTDLVRKFRDEGHSVYVIFLTRDAIILTGSNPGLFKK